MIVGPIVTNIDREWAMGQMPFWCRRGMSADDEIVDDGAPLDVEVSKDDSDKPSWSMLVSEEIEKFERHFSGARKSYGDWTYLWREVWWPRVDPRKRFPRSAPREFQPFFRAGTLEFERALSLALPNERAMWLRFGIAQFKPDDPRLPKIAPNHPIAEPARISAT